MALDAVSVTTVLDRRTADTTKERLALDFVMALLREYKPLYQRDREFIRQYLGKDPVADKIFSELLPLARKILDEVLD